MVNKTIPSQDLRKAKLLANPTCSHCGVTKTIVDFPPQGVDYWCSDCRKDYARGLYHKRRAKLSSEELKVLKDEVNKRQNARRAEHLAKMTPENLAEYREKVNRENTERRLAVRDEVYRAYGGYKCACCGVTEPKFLSIDHINNDGAEHKRKEKLHTGEQMHRWLKRKGFPEGFQVLCMNCNWGKRETGVCPHNTGKV